MCEIYMRQPISFYDFLQRKQNGMRYSIFYLQVTKRHWVLSFEAINLFITTEANEKHYHGKTS